MTYEEALHVLASWAGRSVVVSLQPDESERYAVNLSGRLARRQDVSVAEEGRADGTSFFFSLAEDRLPVGFYLDRDEFTDAVLQDRGRVLAVQLRGAKLIMESADRFS